MEMWATSSESDGDAGAAAEMRLTAWEQTLKTSDSERSLLKATLARANAAHAADAADSEDGGSEDGGSAAAERGRPWPQHLRIPVAVGASSHVALIGLCCGFRVSLTPLAATQHSCSVPALL